MFTISFAGVNELSDYYTTIRCLVCEGQSIQESDTEFAINIKEQIQKKYNYKLLDYGFLWKYDKNNFYPYLILFLFKKK